MADSNIWAILGVLLMCIDVFFFLTWLILLLGSNDSATLANAYRVIDWVTAVTFLAEAGLRMFSYGFIIYFRSALRAVDLFISMANVCAVIAMAFPNSPSWIKATRFLRLPRMILILAMMRKRTNKWQTQIEVEELEILLEMERSNQNKLTKWKIKSDAIAVGDTAGEGGFGTVHLGLFRGTLVAVKQLFETDTRAHSASIADEAVILVNLRHPNVVLFMGFVHEPKRLWIVTEYCSRGSLRDLLDNERMELSHSRILKFALGAARGLAYLHGQDPRVLHLDLKTSNILISSGWDAKLADFGLARSADKPQEGKFVGTIQYSAPEILESNIFGTEADIYAFGICLWEMAAREIPFHNVPKMDLICGVVQSHMRPDLSRIKIDDDKVELPAQLNIDDIEVREASKLAVLRSIASSQSETGPVQKQAVRFFGTPAEVASSPVTPKLAANKTWGDGESGSGSHSTLEHSQSSGSVSTSFSAWHVRTRRQSAPLLTNRPALTTQPALAASATQPVTMDHSGNSYSAGEVAEATELVHEQAGLTMKIASRCLSTPAAAALGPRSPSLQPHLNPAHLHRPSKQRHQMSATRIIRCAVNWRRRRSGRRPKCNSWSQKTALSDTAVGRGTARSRCARNIASSSSCVGRTIPRRARRLMRLCGVSLA